MSDNFLPSGDPARFEAVMGFQLAIWEPAFCQFRVPLGPQHLNRAGRPHGGVVSALIDAAGMFAGNKDGETGCRRNAVTVSMACNFIGAAKGELLVCEGKLMKSGSSTFFAEARLLDGDDGALLASGQGAYKFMELRQPRL